MTLDSAIQLTVAETIKFCGKSIYPEPTGGIHEEIIPGVWKWVKDHIEIKPGDRVVDIGPGTGQAMRLFEADDLIAIGVSASQEECESLNGGNKTGLICLYMDMHEIGRMSKFTHGIWARHVLEHSFMPLAMLRSMKAALKSGGWVYIETPAPGTACQHDSNNPNHFSVLGRPMWKKLIADAGFRIIDEASITFKVEAGDDEYYSFLAVHA